MRSAALPESESTLRAPTLYLTSRDMPGVAASPDLIFVITPPGNLRATATMERGHGGVIGLICPDCRAWVPLGHRHVCERRVA